MRFIQDFRVVTWTFQWSVLHFDNSSFTCIGLVNCLNAYITLFCLAKLSSRKQPSTDGNPSSNRDDDITLNCSFQVNTADILFKVMIMLKVLCIIDADSFGSSRHSNNNDDNSNNGNDTGSGFNQTFFFTFERGFSPDTKTCYLVKSEGLTDLVFYLSGAVVLNFFLGLVSWWRCYANNYLHWGALATWFVLLVQGKKGLIIISFIISLKISWVRRRTW